MNYSAAVSRMRIGKSAFTPADSQGRQPCDSRSCCLPNSSSSSTLRPPRHSISTIPSKLLPLADEVIE